MTTTEIAKLAILGLPASNRLHIDIVEIMRGLKLNSDAAVALRSMIVKEWMTADGERRDILGLAKTVINQYARNYSLR